MLIENPVKAVLESNDLLPLILKNLSSPRDLKNVQLVSKLWHTHAPSIIDSYIEEIKTKDAQFWNTLIQLKHFCNEEALSFIDDHCNQIKTVNALVIVQIFKKNSSDFIGWTAPFDKTYLFKNPFEINGSGEELALHFTQRTPGLSLGEEERQSLMKTRIAYHQFFPGAWEERTLLLNVKNLIKYF